VSGTDTEPQNIGSGEVPIAMFHADDDKTIPVATAKATCEITKSYGNVCEFFEYATGGHAPGFLDDNLGKIIEQASQFMCRRVIGPTGCKRPDSP
jgi:hypothetical protein